MAEAIRKSRQQWHELDEPPRRALLLQRPGDTQLSKWSGSGPAGKLTGDEMIALTRQCVVGWRGVTEADLLGAAVGSSDDQPFSREVFDVWAEDQMPVLRDVAVAVLAMIKAHADAKVEASGN